MSAMTTPEYLMANAKNYGNEKAISTKDSDGNMNHISWSEFHDQTASVAKSLIAMGFQEGDKLSIYSYNRVEWYTSYHAANMCNGAAVGVYHTCSPEEVEWVVGNSDSKVVFVGDNPMDGGNKEKMCAYRLHEIMDKLNKVETVVVMDGVDMPEHDKCISWSDFIEKGTNIEYSEIEKRVENITPEDTFSLIYTSGTTGNPKGVELSHDNIDFELAEVWKLQEFERGWGYVSWLPCAHVFGQLVDCHAHIRWGLHMTVVDAPLNVIDYAKEVQPHLFIGVPRIYEKVYSNLVAKLGGKIKLAKVPLLGGIIKKKAKEAIGMSNCVYAITGAAPINPDILKLFHTLDIPLYEGYGMTETTAGASLGYKKNHKFGTVGKPFSGTELMISDSGEILFRGRHVMKGYYKNPEATADTIDADGWLHSGDKGEIDSDGYVKITGRIKELYVSSGGKNIAPLVIEETMKSIPMVSQCMLIGDGRKYCSALFTLDVGAILRDKHGMDPAKIPKDPAVQITTLESFGKTLSDYTDSEEIFNEMQVEVSRLNGQFSNPEQIKKFTILPRDLNVDFGELTPTLKIRRIQIRENWASEIESMYEGA
ncbi:long-chain fatty acid--CoA ligase [Candidatus Poseidoniales archaeon]|nr:long-chain fatty acid--CoA ligase [Euryarchaeota archaeon]MDC3310310.1 long-chain fatty acid--CoA ligase [Candidatus Poseidoniales archaeon]